MIRSLRWRMQVWHALILVTVLAVFGSAVYYLQWQSRLQEIDARLEQTGEQVMSRLWRLVSPGGGRWPRRMNRGDRPNERRQGPAPGDPRDPPNVTLWRQQENPTATLVVAKFNVVGDEPADSNQSEMRIGSLAEFQTRLLTSRTRRISFLQDGPDPGELPPPPPPPERNDGRDRVPMGPRRGEPPPFPPGPPQLRIPLVGAKLVVDDDDLERLGFPEELAMLFDSETPSSRYFAVWDLRGKLTLKTVTAPDHLNYPATTPSSGTLWTREFETRNGNREITMATRFGLKLVLGEPLTTAMRAQHATGFGLLLVGGGVLAVGLLGGTWISNRAIDPIKQMTRTAESISARNLTERIDVSETDSELGSLATVLNQTFERLQEAFEQQSRFTADASHELRTPVAVLLSQTELTLSRARSPEEYQEALETCHRTAARMRTLVEGLLFLARMDAGEHPLELDRFDLGALVEETVDDLIPLAEDRQLTVSRKIVPVQIRSHRPRIQQVLTNLMTNAIRYNRPQGAIRIRVDEEEGQAVLAVEDTGIGIAEEDLTHVFERFYRVDKARTLAEGGTGLGLAICKTIVDSLQGTIEITSVQGEGTTVTVRLPLERAMT